MRLTGLGATTTVTPQVQTIAQTIQQVEGYYPGSLAYRNNNPGNLVYVGQAGATADANGYAVFPSYQDGLNALYNQIGLYASRGLTIDQMMQTYCPSSVSGCNPAVYAQTVAGSLGVSTGTLVSDAIAGNGTTTPIDISTGLPIDTGSVQTQDSGVVDWGTWGMIAAGVAVLFLVANR